MGICLGLKQPKVSTSTKGSANQAMISHITFHSRPFSLEVLRIDPAAVTVSNFVGIRWKFPADTLPYRWGFEGRGPFPNLPESSGPACVLRRGGGEAEPLKAESAKTC